MNQVDAGDELSMEDILASIRQIIAEEPKAVAPTPPLQTPSVPGGMAQPVPAQVQYAQPQVAVTAAAQPQAPQSTVVVSTVGLPQGYAIPRPDPNVRLNGSLPSAAVPAGIALPSFSDARLRGPNAAPVTPRVPVSGAGPDNASTGTLAARLNDVFGSGAALRQPENGRPVPQYGVQTVKSALDADLADLMDDDGRAAAVIADVVAPSPTPAAMPALDPVLAPAPVLAPVAVSAPSVDPISVAPPLSNAATVTQPAVGVNVAQGVVAPRISISVGAPRITPAHAVSAAIPAVVSEPNAVAPVPAGVPPFEPTTPSMTSVMAAPHASVLAAPHAVPAWLNRTADPAPPKVTAPPLEVSNPIPAAPPLPVQPTLVAEPKVETAAPPKVRPAPVVIAAMASPRRPVTVDPVIAVPSGQAVLPPDAVAVVNAVTTQIESAVSKPDVAAIISPPPVLSMADVLPASDAAMPWVPAPRVDLFPVEAVEPVGEASRDPAPVEMPAPLAAAIEQQADAAAASALGALAAGLAASRVAVAPEIVSPTPTLPTPPVSNGVAVEGEAVETISADAQATVSANGIATQDAHGEGVALEPVYPHDETAVELLRPMLRHWLDSNMPRIVEKALRAELAANPPGAAKTDSKP